MLYYLSTSPLRIVLIYNRTKPEIVEGILLCQLVRRPIHEVQVIGGYANRVEDRNEDILVVFRTLRDEIQRSFEVV